MDTVASVLGGSAASLVLVWFGLMFCVSASAPFVFFSVVRNVSRTRVALERIADALETQRGSSGGGGVLGI